MVDRCNPPERMNMLQFLVRCSYKFVSFLRDEGRQRRKQEAVKGSHLLAARLLFSMKARAEICGDGH